MAESPERSPFSVGIESVLIRAALDTRFRDQLLYGRDALLASGELGLGASEVRLLQSIPASQLALAIECAAVPSPTRRGFLRAVPATLLAGLAGCVLANDAGGDIQDASLSQNDFHSCDGIRPDVPSCVTTEPGGDYWIHLGGKTAFLHLPPSWRPLISQTLCIAFHDVGRSCLSMIELLRDTADSFHFALAAVEWSGDPAQAVAEADALATHVETLETQYCVRSTDLVTAGYGSGASSAIAAAITDRTACWKAMAFAGDFPAGWLSLPLDPGQSRVYLTVGEDDPVLPSAQANLAALAGLGADTRLHTYPGPSTPQASDPEAAWTWLG